MKHHTQLVLATAAMAVISALQPALAQTIPAFPGASGPGGTATGGRGGDVYHVTNLEFDLNGVIPGSFKYGINNAPSAGRTIVFDVGGTIFQNGGGAGWWFRSGKDNITIAGQTAPGAGVTVAGVATKWTGNNNILRNITVRPNKDPVNPTSYTYDAFSLQLRNSIVDHVSATWFSDEGISLTDAGANTTVQYANISEGLNYDSHSFGSIIATEVNGTHYSYRHNLYAHNNSRMPRLGSAVFNGVEVSATTDFTDNVMYNWINKAGYSGTVQRSKTNFINNYFIKGNNNGATLFSGGDDATSVGYTEIYQSGNVYDGNKDGVFNGSVVGSGSFAGGRTIVGTPFTVLGTAAPDSAATALQRVLDYGGANWTNRNPIDQRIVNSVRTGTGSLTLDTTAGPQAIEWATVLQQRPNLSGVAPFTRPANWDTDQDGMPNTWESAHGLNPNAASNNGDFDLDGYTNLEEYINELSEWPAPKPLVFTGATNARYEQITNWDITWQPSKYDEAQINNGTVTIDSVGQHAGVLKIASGATDVATLTILNGWIDVAGEMRIGASGGTGRVLQSGGVAQVGGTLTVGATGVSASSYELSGGSVVAGVLKLVGGARLTTGQNGANAVAAGALSIDTAAGSAVDMNCGLLVGAGTPRSAVEALVVMGRDGGTWAGPGLTSGGAALNPATALGVLSGEEYLALGGTVFYGFNVSATDTLVKYTWYGDTDLNGVVDFDDYVRVDGGYNAGSSGWVNGDLDYSGLVDFDDYVLIDLAYNAQNGTLLRAVDFLSGHDRSMGGMSADPALEKVVEHFGWFGTDYATHFLSAVPEPSAVVVLGSCLILWSRRRRGTRA